MIFFRSCCTLYINVYYIRLIVLKCQRVDEKTNNNRFIIRTTLNTLKTHILLESKKL